MNALPILSTIPRSGTWFLRYTVAFLCHLQRGGRIDDRLTGRVFGNPSGPLFDFQDFEGGPLFWVHGVLPSENLFIGHTVCPGFEDLGAETDWWRQTIFHVPGYDYFHEWADYQHTPIALAPHRSAPVCVPALERSARDGRDLRIALVYRNPIDQATSFYRYCQHHIDPTYSRLKGRQLADVPFLDYLFECALPSYAKQFISFQAMATRHPDIVRLVSYEQLIREPVANLTAVLNQLSGRVQEWSALADAVWLARSKHLKAIEREVGRSLDGTRTGTGSHIGEATTSRDGGMGAMTRSRVMAFLRGRGIDPDLFDWPAAHQVEPVAYKANP